MIFWLRRKRKKNKKKGLGEPGPFLIDIELINLHASHRDLPNPWKEGQMQCKLSSL
jgi:hypothetical protein